MSMFDKYGDVACPKCVQNKVHAWYFPANSGSPSSSGADACKGCGYQPNEKETKVCVSALWTKY